jgi:hypothetical protein
MVLSIPHMEYFVNIMLKIQRLDLLVAKNLDYNNFRPYD